MHQPSVRNSVFLHNEHPTSPVTSFLTNCNKPLSQLYTISFIGLWVGLAVSD